MVVHQVIGKNGLTNQAERKSPHEPASQSVAVGRLWGTSGEHRGRVGILRPAVAEGGRGVGVFYADFHQPLASGTRHKKGRLLHDETFGMGRKEKCFYI